MKSPKATLFPSLPPPSQFDILLKVNFMVDLGTRQAPPTPHGGQGAELLGAHGLSSFLSTPSFERTEEKGGFEYLNSEFGQKNQHFLKSHCSKWAQSEGTECQKVKARALRALMRSPSRREEICFTFHIAFTEVITSAY